MALNKNTISRGEIWYVKFEPQVGNEIRKIRPAIVVDADFGQLVGQVVPITAWQDRLCILPYMVKIQNFESLGLSKPSTANCSQIKSCAIERFIEKIGIVDDAFLFEIHQATVRIWSPLYTLNHN
ncbi:type II toxin-antitoxin system PemK/MazF family toxin [Helicobacter labetoulli]|uniref:type II toxin-antitoxin system PemK/MazF family toxin n=1 Tax=Helicobacter labetoulli TaxID=2315333 RepID=UPI000EF6BCBF|nr:type II toxin-antitoxin system PemK/MazF family toxin [Helicobacter labetoulli]